MLALILQIVKENPLLVVVVLLVAVVLQTFPIFFFKYGVFPAVRALYEDYQRDRRRIREAETDDKIRLMKAEAEEEIRLMKAEAEEEIRLMKAKAKAEADEEIRLMKAEAGAEDISACDDSVNAGRNNGTARR